MSSWTDFAGAEALALSSAGLSATIEIGVKSTCGSYARFFCTTLLAAIGALPLIMIV
ncbi:hypothetical protein LZK73_34080 (plasmid) [Neorhizobium galegae]|nr:hypothetical protein LZK73_34080 [Neorhizobium galegae]